MAKEKEILKKENIAEETLESTIELYVTCWSDELKKSAQTPSNLVNLKKSYEIIAMMAVEAYKAELNNNLEK